MRSSSLWRARYTGSTKRRPRAAPAHGDDAAAQAAAPQFVQEPISEYHLYTLERRTNIQNNETKQISLLDATGVSFDKIFEVDGQQYYYHNAQRPGEPIKEPVQVHIKFKNSQENSLGMPAAGGNRAGVSRRLKGAGAVHRRRPHRPYSQG